MAKKWPEKVIQRSFIKEHSFPNGLYVLFHKYIFTGYIGSALGGYTYDIMGFENSTLVVIAMQILALMAIFGLICSPKTTRPANDDGEKQTLLRPNCQKSDRNANYHSFEVLV